MTTTLSLLHDDVEILMQRALTGAKLTMFGEDGNGKHGVSTFPVTATVRSISIYLSADNEDDCDNLTGAVELYLDGYDASITGHAITDANLRISLNMLLKAQSIDPAVLNWHEIGYQQTNSIMLKIDVPLLLDWA